MQILKCDESVTRCRNRLIRLMWLSSQTMKLNPVCVVTVHKPNSPVDQSERTAKEIVGSADSNGSSPSEGPRFITDG